jgi:hypothetical protein
MAVVFEVFRLKSVWTAALVAATLGAAGDAPAQQPSQAQLNALRSSCRGDYMAHCASVPTGGAPALNCLKQHMSALSGGCQTAVNAISPAAPPAAAASAPASAPAAAPPQVTQPAPPPVMQAAPAAPPTMQAAPAARKPGPAQRQAEARAVGQACRADYRVHCAGIPPGGSASIACLKRNARTLSRGCLQALVSAPTVAAAPAPAPAPAHIAAPAAPPPMEPAPLLVTPREERFIIRSACGADFAAYCGGLRPGLGRVAACLHYNRANLSPRCQQALIALHEGR